MEKEKSNDRIVKFFPKQFAAFNFSTQFGATVCGSQSGKTFVGAHWAGKKIIEFPDKNGAIIAPTYAILRQATMEKFFQVFPEMRRYYKEHKSVIELPTGGKVFIRSADNPLGIEGMTIHWWWFDEAGMAPRLAWVVLRTRVSMTGGQGFITTTPHNMGWLYGEYYVPWKSKIDDQLSFFSWKSIENPFFSKEFYDAEKRRLRPEEFSRRYEGEFRKMEGLVYELSEKHIIDPLDIVKRSEARIMGIDWGFRAPAAIVICYKYDNVWYVVDEWKRTEKTTAEIIEVAAKMILEHRVSTVYTDSAEPDRIEECKRAKLPVEDKVDKDIKGGISFIQQLIREDKFFIFSNCKETIDETNTYQYDEIKDDRPIKDEPLKLNDHLCLVGSTKILMANGYQKRLDRIKVGNKVKTKRKEQKVVDCKLTRKNADIYEIILSDNRKLKGTKDHRIYTKRGIMPLDALRYGDIIEVYQNKQILLWKKQLFLISRDIIGMVDTIHQLVDAKKVGRDYIRQFGNITMVKYPKDSTYTIKTNVAITMNYIILRLERIMNIYQNILKKGGKTQSLERKVKNILKIYKILLKYGIEVKKAESGIQNTEKILGLKEKHLKRFVKYVEKNIKHISLNEQDFAIKIVKRKRCGKEDVYNLTIEKEHNYYANEILVKNCDAMRYAIYNYPRKGRFVQPLASEGIKPYYPEMGF